MTIPPITTWRSTTCSGGMCRNVYRALDAPIPEELFVTNITTQPPSAEIRRPTGLIQPEIDGEVTSYFEWVGAGSFEADGRRRGDAPGRGRLEPDRAGGVRFRSRAPVHPRRWGSADARAAGRSARADRAIPEAGGAAGRAPTRRQVRGRAAAEAIDERGLGRRSTARASPRRSDASRSSGCRSAASACGRTSRWRSS